MVHGETCPTHNRPLHYGGIHDPLKNNTLYKGPRCKQRTSSNFGWRIWLACKFPKEQTSSEW
jgi:hypothetical protein